MLGSVLFIFSVFCVVFFVLFVFGLRPLYPMNVTSVFELSNPDLPFGFL
jgi:hypothetical protein